MRKRIHLKKKKQILRQLFLSSLYRAPHRKGDLMNIWKRGSALKWAAAIFALQFALLFFNVSFGMFYPFAPLLIYIVGIIGMELAVLLKGPRSKTLWRIGAALIPILFNVPRRLQGALSMAGQYGLADAALWVGLLVVFLVYWRFLAYDREKEAADRQKRDVALREIKRESAAAKARGYSSAKALEVYNECRKHDITDVSQLNSPEKRQRLELIVKAAGIPCESADRLRQIFAECKEESETKDAIARQKFLETLKAWETEKFNHLTFYASLHGQDKPVAIFEDYIQLTDAKLGKTTATPLRRESDGAVLAGMASGIGGTVPALMSLSTTAQHNEEVRKYNEAAQTMNVIAGGATLAYLDDKRYAKATLKEVRTKLTADLPREEVFKHLTFTGTEVSVSESGSITVTTRAFAEDFTIFDGLPALVDGSVIAEIYDKAKKIGEAVMVFPKFGSDSAFKWEIRSKSAFGNIDTIGKTKYSNFVQMEAPDAEGWGKDRFLEAYDKKSVWWKNWGGNKTDKVRLEGICLFAGDPSREYTVKFVPGDLWAMERFEQVTK